jgi:cation-transporting ATPase F
MRTNVSDIGSVAHELSVVDAERLLDADHGRGLSTAEATRRRTRYGANVVVGDRGPGRLRRWAAQFHNPLIYVLLAAAAVMVSFGEFVDAGVIAGVVALNAVIGFVQESRAQRALDALSRLVPAQANVIRDGETRRLPAADLVPGDTVLLAAGDRVPADVRLIQVRLFEVDESALTGESVPVAKDTGAVPATTALADRVNSAFAGTMVTRGSAVALVVGTGSATQLGVIQRLVSGTATVATPLTRKLAGFATQLSVVIVVVAVLTFAVALVRGMALSDAFTAVVALAVGAIPEGLPAAVSIVLAIGVVRMSRRRAVVRHLPAVETLGSTTVICTDKTGTLTENRMTVTDVVAGGRRFAPDAADPAGVACLTAGVACNDAALRQVDGQWAAEGDPTETALVVAAQAAGLDPGDIGSALPRVDVLPFDSALRFMATVHRRSDGTLVGYVKGAAEDVLARCRTEVGPDGRLRPVDHESARRVQTTLARRGLRVLAFATFTPGTGPLVAQVADATLLGLQAMHDPPRHAAARAISACRAAGVGVKMITGDHADTAKAIAGSVGLAGVDVPASVLTGAELDQIEDPDLPEAAERTDVFARVSPEQKLRLVRALQERGHVVAMTGDGVNDAPALRRADIGVAMGAGGTDAARQAGDMVLLDDDFATIEAAVEEGRGVFDNLRRFITWTVPTNIGEGMVILAAVLLGATLPIVPVQILWINMTTAVFLGLTMAFEAKERGIMGRPPRPPDQPLLTPTLLRQIGMVTVLLVVAAFAAYHWQIAAGGSMAQARTTAVNVFVCVQIAYLFNCRSLGRSAFTARPSRNPMLLVGIGITVGLQLLLTYVPAMNDLFHTAPIGLGAFAWALGAALAAFLLVEADKVVWRALRPGRTESRGA